jgi:hypothetical protein
MLCHFVYRIKNMFKTYCIQDVLIENEGMGGKSLLQADVISLILSGISKEEQQQVKSGPTPSIALPLALS